MSAVGPELLARVLNEHGSALVLYARRWCNTLLAVEADNDHAVIWTKPDDWSIGGGDPVANLGSPYDNHILVLLCDGAVLTLKWPLEADLLRSLLTYDGGEVVDYGPLLWRGDR